MEIQENQDSYKNSLFHFVTELPDQVREKKKFFRIDIPLIKVMENGAPDREMKGENVRGIT